MATVSFTIAGKPFGKQRPRAGQGRIYTPKETVSFERTVGTIAAPLFPAPFVGPVSLTIVATFGLPASWSNKQKARMLDQPHTQKPDLDNIAKAIKDGLSRIAYADDSQVAELMATKIWAEVPSLHVTVETLEERFL